MLKNYFLLAWRNLQRNKLYGVINIAGLSIGLACCMLIILYSKDEVSYDRFHTNAASIYRVTMTSISEKGAVESTDGNTGMMPGPSFARSIPEIKSFVRVQSEQITVRIGTQVFDQEGLYVDSNFFSVFSFPLREGNAAVALNNPYSVVLSETVARKFFGTAAALGKTIELPTGNEGAFEQFTVTGIAPVSPQNSSIKIQMLLPMQLNLREGRADNQWINFYLNTFVVLHPDAVPAKVETKMQQIYAKEAAAQIQEAREKFGLKSNFQYYLQPMVDMHLSTSFTAQNGLVDASNPIYTRILGGIALFMLLIACINFVNLTIARSLKRAKEIGVRKVIGGGRKQLIAQFLGESMVLSFFAFLFAIGLVLLVLPLFNQLANKALSFSYLLDAKLIAGYVSLFLLTSLLAGFYPALVLSGFDPVKTLYNRLPLGGRNYLAKGLVVLQFTLTTFLIIATITVYAQFKFLTRFDLGYDDQNLVTVNVSRMKADKVAVLRRELMAHNGISNVAVRQGGFWMTGAKVDGKDILFDLEVVDSAYLPALKLPLVAGRNFSAAYPSDSTTAVLVNEAFMQQAGWKNLDNRQVDFFYDNQKFNVIGVVKNYHYASLMEEIKPQLFIMHPKYDYGQLLIRIQPTATSASLQHIAKVVRTQFPFVPYSYEFKDAANVKQYAAEEKWKQIISFAAVLTIFISCIGLFGLATLAAEKRTKEVGIRKVLGASVQQIALKLTGNFLQLVMLAAIIAFPVAWWALNKWLQHYPYRVSVGPWIFALAAFMVCMIAVITISYQAIRAAMANPVKSLKTE